MYVGFLNYYEQGCGIRIIIKTAKTKDELKEGIDNYFLVMFESIDFLELVECIETDKTLTDEMTQLLKLLKHYCPVAYKNLMKYHLLDLSFEYAINLS